MKFCPELASIHGYLCADGYVIKNPISQKHKYYYIGFRNTNSVLLNDFKEKFAKVFQITPIITKNRDRCKIQNKEIVLRLIKEFNSFYSADWHLPDMSKDNLRHWLRAYFDSDGWVNSIKGKDRKIGLESVNLNGLRQIKEVLHRHFKIKSSILLHKNRNIEMLAICGKDDLEKYRKNIGFLHPKKLEKLNEALNSYVNYNWVIPDNGKELAKIVLEKGKVSYVRKEVRFNSIVKENLMNLRNKLLKLNIKSKLNGPWKNSYGSVWYCLSLKIDDFNKLKRR